MSAQASDLARRLAERAELVCRHYLSNGRRVGRYWIVGDVHNARGRSMFVRLRPGHGGKGMAGKWTDAATGEHGDLLDIIQENNIGGALGSMAGSLFQGCNAVANDDDGQFINEVLSVEIFNFETTGVLEETLHCSTTATEQLARLEEIYGEFIATYQEKLQ